jgi:hypothetical protein
MPMPWHALADQFSLRHVQRRKQRGRAVALVIVRHRPAPSLLQRQTRLRTIQRLDLALLVNAQHQGMLRRVQVQPHNVSQLLHEPAIVAQLECADQMRLEAVGPPDTIDHRAARAQFRRQRPTRPASVPSSSAIRSLSLPSAADKITLARSTRRAGVLRPHDHRRNVRRSLSFGAIAGAIRMCIPIM